MMHPSEDPILQVEGLRTYFDTELGIVKAVDGVSFSLSRGRVLGLVGESGSGKSVTGHSIIGLVDPPGRIVDGKIFFKGQDLSRISAEDLRLLRGNCISMVFQDSMTTLNPVLRIGTQMIGAILAHRDDIGRREARALARDMLGRVGIPSPEERLDAYPHQYSGGMRQRVAIATALINSPDIVIADEPTTALDVTIQSQILSEVQELCRTTGTSLIWITHDLALIGALANEVCVMYAGRIVEQGPVKDVLNRPCHPYPRCLIDSVPSRNPRGKLLAQIPGAAPSPLALPSGCAFHPRCPRSDGRLCVEVAPESSVIANGREVRCHYPLTER